MVPMRLCSLIFLGVARMSMQIQPRRFEIVKLEERIAPSCGCLGLPQLITASANVCGVAGVAAALQTNPLHAGATVSVPGIALVNIDP